MHPSFSGSAIRAYPKNNVVPRTACKARCLGALLWLLSPLAGADTLEQLIAATLRSHPAVQAGQSQRQAAAAGVDNARWQFYPTPSIALGADHAVLVAGNVVKVSVTMSEATHMTGTPQLALDIGGVKVHADYVSGSGGAQLVFNYTIAAGQSDGNGIGIAVNGLGLNGGALHDQAGNLAVPAHAAQPDNGGYLVDALAPTVNTVEFPITSGGNTTVKSSEAGMVYLVHDSVAVNGLASITGAAGELWNAMPVPVADQGAGMAAKGLADGS